MKIYTVNPDYIAIMLDNDEVHGEAEIKYIINRILKDKAYPDWDNFVVEIFAGIKGALCIARPKTMFHVTASPLLFGYLLEYFTE